MALRRTARTAAEGGSGAAPAARGGAVLSRDAAARMRAGGHRLPEFDWVLKRGGFNPAEMRFVLSYLWTCRCLLVAADPSVPVFELKEQLRGAAAALRTRGEEDEWKRRCLRRFLAHSRTQAEKGNGADDEFAGGYDFLCRDSTHAEMVRMQLTVLRMEEEEAAGLLPKGSARDLVYGLYRRDGMREATEEERRTGSAEIGDGTQWQRWAREALEQRDLATQRAERGEEIRVADYSSLKPLPGK